MSQINNIGFNFSSATIVAIIGAAIAVAVSFGAHLSQGNISSVMKLVGLLAGALVIGGGVKTAHLLRAGVLPGGTRFHFTPASIVAVIGAAVAVAVSFGLHLTQENISSVMTLVGLIAGAVTIGGGITSGGLLAAGLHPVQLARNARNPVPEPNVAAPHGHSTRKRT